jgi:hypothetical protein
MPETSDKKYLIVGVLLGVTFSLLAQALDEIIYDTLITHISTGNANWVVVLSATFPASICLYLAMKELKRT